MSKEQRNIYCFISDENKKFYRAVQQNDGSYAISSSSNPYPIEYNPKNLVDSEIEFATNEKYFSLVRTISYPLDFVKDGAAILRNFYFLRKGIATKCYLTIIEWNGVTGIYELSYHGKIALSQKIENPKAGTFSVPLIDDSAWGVLSQNDSVVYAIDCSRTNPKSVRVLIDGVTLVNKYTFQTVQAPIINNTANPRHLIPFVLINQDGDSAGIIAKNQALSDYDAGTAYFPPDSYVPPEGTWFEYTSYALTGETIEGSFKFIASINDPINGAGGLWIYFITSTGQMFTVLKKLGGATGHINIGQIYDIPYSFTGINLVAGERVYFVCEMRSNAARNFTITPIVTNCFVSTKTVTEPVIVVGLRAIDLLQQLVAKATKNRYTINSEFFTTYNKDICFSGDSLRGIPNAMIYSSFRDWFTTFDAINFLAIRCVNGALFVEQATTIYDSTTGTLLDLGEAIDIETTPAIEHFVSEVEVGSADIDYRHPSGRLEFNSTNTFSLPFDDISNKLNLVAKYRLGCFDIIFLILDYQGGSTVDNSGDKNVYCIKITDEIAYTTDNVETFENVTIDDALLEPIIKSPRNNAIINFNKPNIKGICNPGLTVNIYADGVLDGTTTADANGNWTYDIVTALQEYIPGVETGIHFIQATFTDTSAPTSDINILVDTSYATAESIIYPEVGDTLYNNKPLIKGTAPNGTNIDISLDGNIIGSVLTDNSGYWEFKVTVPFSNANHTLSINLGVDTVNFDVNSFVEYPLITYIGSELDGFPVANNLPLIQGVAKPGTLVTLWLNYITYSSLGNCIADANGNWSFQTILTTYIDPLSNIPVILAPIQNGLSIISTSLTNHTVGVVVSGYKLSRPLYSSITGVTDNSVFNTEYSPKRMLLAHKSRFAAMLKQQPRESINFQKPGKNGLLRTILNGVTISENSDVPVSSLGSPIALLENGLVKVATSNTFAKTLYDFSNAGVITVSFRGNQLYFLPIGSMKIANIASKVQDWKLLFAPTTNLVTLLNLYKNGTTINLMANSIYHSDYNSLHGVEYDFVKNPKYNSYELYQEWFENRNGFWLLSPSYIQKYQTSETDVRDQIITNGVSNVKLKIYRCSDAYLVDTIDYNPIANPPIPPPSVILEAVIDMSSYPPDQYFCVMIVSDTPVMIFERFEIRENWNNTILIESSSSINMVGAYFSTGFKTILRLDGIVKKWQPDIVTNTAKFEDANSETLYAQVGRKRTIMFGDARGEPDYMAIKIANACTLDELAIEGVDYALADGEKLEPSEEVNGFPLFYYEAVFTQRINQRGLKVAGVPGGSPGGVTLVVDALAFGLPPGSLINISMD